MGGEEREGEGRGRQRGESRGQSKPLSHRRERTRDSGGPWGRPHQAPSSGPCLPLPGEIKDPDKAVTCGPLIGCLGRGRLQAWQEEGQKALW